MPVVAGRFASFSIAITGASFESRPKRRNPYDPGGGWNRSSVDDVAPVLPVLNVEALGLMGITNYFGLI